MKQKTQLEGTGQRKLLGVMIILIGILAILPMVSAELSYGSWILVNNYTSIVQYRGMYALEDTSATGVGREKNTPVTISYQTNPLPFVLTPYGFAGSVDWCNLTLTHNKEVYDSSGNLISSTSEVQSYLFNSGISTGQITINLRSRDFLTVDMSCHYTDANSLFVEQILFGSFGTYFPSYECAGCTQYTLEQLSHQSDVNWEVASNSAEIWGTIQKLIDLNYQIWIIASWFIKLALVLVGVGLIFSGFWYVYMFLKKLEGLI